MPRVPPEIKVDLDHTTIDPRLSLVATMAVMAYVERFLPDNKLVLLDSKLSEEFSASRTDSQI
jgi:hypothetical protein